MYCSKILLMNIFGSTREPERMQPLPIDRESTYHALLLKNCWVFVSLTFRGHPSSIYCGTVLRTLSLFVTFAIILYHVSELVASSGFMLWSVNLDKISTCQNDMVDVYSTSTIGCIYKNTFFGAKNCKQRFVICLQSKLSLKKFFVKICSCRY